VAASDLGRRKTVNPESDEEFHDGGSSEDIFDLFNATGGILRQDGLLDISRLDAYGEREAEELNVPRLREIWEHTASASGCKRCAEIVSMLVAIRVSLREEDDKETTDEGVVGRGREAAEQEGGEIL
jgi:hypothetical protein